MRDVHAGTIAKHTGNPHDTDLWEWRRNRRGSSRGVPDNGGG
jgi:hypothetical protein